MSVGHLFSPVQSGWTNLFPVVSWGITAVSICSRSCRRDKIYTIYEQHRRLSPSFSNWPVLRTSSARPPSLTILSSSISFPFADPRERLSSSGQSSSTSSWGAAAEDRLGLDEGSIGTAPPPATMRSKQQPRPSYQRWVKPDENGKSRIKAN